MTILQVISNVKHNGDFLAKGTFLEVDEAAGDFEQLIAAGAMRIVEGAENEAQAVELIAKQEAEKAEQAQAAEAAKPQDTWAPKPAEPAAPAPEEVAAPADTTDAQPAEPLAPEVGQGDQPPAPAAGDNL